MAYFFLNSAYVKEKGKKLCVDILKECLKHIFQGMLYATLVKSSMGNTAKDVMTDEMKRDAVCLRKQANVIMHIMKCIY